MPTMYGDLRCGEWAVDGAGGGCKGANLTALSVWKSIDFPLFSKINWRIILRAISDQARRWSFG